LSDHGARKMAKCVRQGCSALPVSERTSKGWLSL
jgi:hypothetical protein